MTRTAYLAALAVALAACDGSSSSTPDVRGIWAVALDGYCSGGTLTVSSTDPNIGPNGYWSCGPDQVVARVLPHDGGGVAIYLEACVRSYGTPCGASTCQETFTATETAILAHVDGDTMTGTTDLEVAPKTFVPAAFTATLVNR